MSSENTLRTLKDLTFKDADPTADVVYTEELRAEAVKWIKGFRTEAKFEGIRLISSERDLLSYVFKHFFNLTEEDLK